jgi:hypothetical protein
MNISRENRNCLIACIEHCLKQQPAALSGDNNAIVAFNASARSLNVLLDCVVVREINLPSIGNELDSAGKIEQLIKTLVFVLQDLNSEIAYETRIIIMADLESAGYKFPEPIDAQKTSQND